MISDMTFSRAFPATVLVTLLSLTISGTSLEVAITRGGTARIPCPFGKGTPEDTPQNIFWYYNSGSGSQEILTLFEGNVTVNVAYTDSTELEKDNSTLSLKKVTVKDEGTYRCDVGRHRQTPLYQTSNTLKVYGLAPNTPPAILQCPLRPLNSSTCTLTGHGATNLTCKLPNVYPKTNFSLGLYHEGRGPLGSPLSITEAREDGTFDLETKLEVSETGIWTCKASYLSVEGKEETTASISFYLLKNKDSQTNLALIIVPIVVVIAVVVGVVIFLLLWRRRNHRAQARGHYGQMGNVELGDENQGGIEDETLVNLAEALVDESDLSTLGRNLGIRQFKLNQVSKENERATNVFGTNSILFVWKEKTPAGKQIPMMVKALEESGFESLITEHFPNEAGVPDEKIAALAENLKDEDAIEKLGINLGFRQFKVNQYLKSNSDHGDHSGTLAMLQAWRKKTFRWRQTPNLVEALKNAGIDGSFNNN